MRISLDDFGTGYSSLSCLNRVPLDLLKMDRGLRPRRPHGSGREGVVSAVVSMAHSLPRGGRGGRRLRRAGRGAVGDRMRLGAGIRLRAGDAGARVRRAARRAEIFACGGYTGRGGAQCARGSRPAVAGASAPDAALRAAPLEIANAPTVLVTADLPAELRPGRRRWNRAARRARDATEPDRRDGLYASAPTKGCCSRPSRAADPRAGGARGRGRRRVHACSIRDRRRRPAARPAILFVGRRRAQAAARPAQPLPDLDPARAAPDAELRDVTRSALYGTPPGAAQRQHPRARCDLLANVAVGDHSEAALLSSLSIRGAFLELVKRPPPERASMSRSRSRTPRSARARRCSTTRGFRRYARGIGVSSTSSRQTTGRRSSP